MSDDKKGPIGKILTQRKLVSQADVDAALQAQKRSGKSAPLASVLVEQGKLAEVEALRALSEQHGVPGIDLSQVAIVLEHLNVLQREIAETNRILPVLMRGDRIFLAMADPKDKRVIDELEFVTGKKVYPYIAVHATLIKTIAAVYDAKARGERHYLGPRVPPETLKALGIGPNGAPLPPESAPAVHSPKPGGKPPPRIAPFVPPTAPAAPAVVLSEPAGGDRLSTEVSTGPVDFGSLDGEISRTSHLPEDLRVRVKEAAAAMGTGTGKLILVVDDEEEIRTMLKRTLTQKGYRVLEADKGLLALRLVKNHVPDLIILDAMLPELHGFDIARRIKGSGKYGAIPVIMVSAVHRGWRIAQDVKESYGVEEYLEKPFKLAEVLDLVQKLLARSEGQQAEARDPEHVSADAESALNEGIAAYKSGNIDVAIEHLRRGVGIDPLSYRLHFHLALLYGKKGLVYEGIQELERAIELNPRHFPALKNLAVLYEKIGFKNKAVEMWERCAAASPDDATRTSVKEHLLQLL
jgi:CheY-like chemotaxis protein